MLGYMRSTDHDREAAADLREDATDQREDAADQREDAADQREARIDQLLRGTGVTTASVQQRAQEAISRSRQLIARSTAAMDRCEALLRRQAQPGPAGTSRDGPGDRPQRARRPPAARTGAARALSPR